MKRFVAILLTLAMILCATALAETTVERNYAPEAGSGWMAVEINGEAVELAYTGMTKGMTGTTYSFASDEYTVNLALDKKLEIGTEAGENSINQIEVISKNTATEGYYFTKKSSGQAVDSTVTMEKMGEGDNIWQGVFRVTVTTTDRYVGDMQPGILPELMFENGEFCFCVE